ncbi:hypothetical protein CYMTET_31174 [Cymbomonas tetramitiformis]|uniref:Uncharacterized protein n=1 Tax=Cymbomonas tetramitiformis TaxID=36881 RepID=A0AAE0FHY4_9CHLO|nr:hypothetical protein CYMTET_31174 [Cymbomonas tetramitiformis]
MYDRRVTWMWCARQAAYEQKQVAGRSEADALVAAERQQTSVLPRPAPLFAKLRAGSMASDVVHPATVAGCMRSAEAPHPPPQRGGQAVREELRKTKDAASREAEAALQELKRVKLSAQQARDDETGAWTQKVAALRQELEDAREQQAGAAAALEASQKRAQASRDALQAELMTAVNEVDHTKAQLQAAQAAARQAEADMAQREWATEAKLAKLRADGEAELRRAREEAQQAGESMKTAAQTLSAAQQSEGRLMEQLTGARMNAMNLKTQFVTLQADLQAERQRTAQQSQQRELQLQTHQEKLAAAHEAQPPPAVGARIILVAMPQRPGLVTVMRQRCERATGGSPVAQIRGAARRGTLRHCSAQSALAEAARAEPRAEGCTQVQVREARKAAVEGKAEAERLRADLAALDVTCKAQAESLTRARGELDAIKHSSSEKEIQLSVGLSRTWSSAGMISGWPARCGLKGRSGLVHEVP